MGGVSSPDETTTNTVIADIDRVLDRGVVTHFLMCPGAQRFNVDLRNGDFAKTHQDAFFVDLTFNLPQDEPPAVSVNGIAATAHRPYSVPEDCRHAPQGFRVRYTVDAKAARPGANAIGISKGENDAHVVWCEAWMY